MTNVRPSTVRRCQWMTIPLLLLVAACLGDPDPVDQPAAFPLAPRRLVIVPSALEVPQGERFQLRLRVFAADGTVIPESLLSATPSWLPGAGVTVVPAGGGAAVLHATGAVGTAVTITVKLGSGVTKDAIVTIVDPEKVAGAVIEAPNAGDPATIAILSGSPDPSPWQVAAFVKHMPLGDKQEREAALLAARFEGILRTVLAEETQPVVLPENQSLEIPVTLWLPAPVEATGPLSNTGAEPGAATIALAAPPLQAIAHANRTLQLNRAGLKLDPEVETYGPYDIIPTECNADRPYKERRLNIYYVDVGYPSGKTCMSGRKDIFIGKFPGETTVAHEIGHALSLYHTEYDKDFSGYPDNLMRSPRYNSSDDRAHLSAGQVFRMNWEARSVISRVTGRTVTKSCTGTSVCPPLAADVR